MQKRILIFAWSFLVPMLEAKNHVIVVGNGHNQEITTKVEQLRAIADQKHYNFVSFDISSANILTPIVNAERACVENIALIQPDQQILKNHSCDSKDRLNQVVARKLLASQAVCLQILNILLEDPAAEQIFLIGLDIDGTQVVNIATHLLPNDKQRGVFAILKLIAGMAPYGNIIVGLLNAAEATRDIAAAQIKLALAFNPDLVNRARTLIQHYAQTKNVLLTDQQKLFVATIAGVFACSTKKNITPDDMANLLPNLQALDHLMVFYSPRDSLMRRLLGNYLYTNFLPPNQRAQATKVTNAQILYESNASATTPLKDLRVSNLCLDDDFWAYTQTLLGKDVDVTFAKNSYKLAPTDKQDDSAQHEAELVAQGQAQAQAYQAQKQHASPAPAQPQQPSKRRRFLDWLTLMLLKK